jgi:hypothetical protein
VDLQVLCQRNCALKLSVSHVFCGFCGVVLVLWECLCAFLVRSVLFFGAQAGLAGLSIELPHQSVSIGADFVQRQFLDALHVFEECVNYGSPLRAPHYCGQRDNSERF